jgi:hypothetical protein
MVNKTLLPPGDAGAKHLSHSSADLFFSGTAFALTLFEPRLGRAFTGSQHPRKRAWEGFGLADH